MAADWIALSSYLKSREGDRVTLSWSELSQIVGGVPASAIDHAVWWSGDRPHTRAWRSAGFDVESKRPGHSVTFRRTSGARSAPSSDHRRLPAPTQSSPAERQPANSGVDLLLVTCVKSKQSVPAAACDLYTSALFQKQRAYAEATDLPWFILSARWGLVRPDEWLSPYELRLDDMSRAYRAAWGAWVAARLEQEVSDVSGMVVEIHAGQSYLEPLSQPLRDLGVSIRTPLTGLSHGQRLAWYDARSTGKHGEGAPSAELSPPADRLAPPDVLVARLRDQDRALTPEQFVAAGRHAADSAGLYSWWVDIDGAHELTAGLGHRVTPGLIYAGLAGATRWPSGQRSDNTLWLRITAMHLGGRHRFSTFRLTLGSILAEARGWSEIDEDELTHWMHEHLRVVSEPFADGDTLGRVEAVVLAELDPPLNLKDVPPNDLRRRLSELRRTYGER
jgi:hypothetical protein